MFRRFDAPVSFKEKECVCDKPPAGRWVSTAEGPKFLDDAPKANAAVSNDDARIARIREFFPNVDLRGKSSGYLDACIEVIDEGGDLTRRGNVLHRALDRYEAWRRELSKGGAPPGSMTKDGRVPQPTGSNRGSFDQVTGDGSTLAEAQARADARARRDAQAGPPTSGLVRRDLKPSNPVDALNAQDNNTHFERAAAKAEEERQAAARGGSPAGAMVRTR